ncbi:uncharacterized protein LOC126571475 [Anopheles aquasalis]|uniref:uncharacterized protein LOC126571475 n=1 Tax=Anopheles aquasalis TaxID=42839 RepID=UPI00215AE5F8|nr:uncharacterized protein LOC126571475 [Anopheles aquasalis]
MAQREAAGSLSETNVIITHLINPHCFWYRPESTYAKDHDYQQFSEALNEHCERLYGRLFAGQPAHGGTILRTKALAAVYHVAQQRWVRCEVDEVVIGLDGKATYQLWALDEGLPIKSTPEYVRVLPSRFESAPPQAMRGAIANILPASKRRNGLGLQATLLPCNKWYAGAGAVSMLQTMVEGALSVSLVCNGGTAKVEDETIHFAEMTITMPRFEPFNVVDVLAKACSEQMIRCSSEEFVKRFPKLQTFTIRRYLNNDGHDKMPVQSANTNPLRTNQRPIVHQGTVLRTLPDSEAVTKVNDWLNSNMTTGADGQGRLYATTKQWQS